MKKTRSKKSSTDVARERVKAQFAPKVPCKNVDAEGFCTGTCAGSLCCKCADYSPRDAAAKPATGETPVVPVEPVAQVANTRERDAAYRLSRQYAKVNGSWKNALEQTVRFGAMLKEWGDFLGEGRGGAPAVAALIGRDTVTDPDGNEIPIDAEVVEKKEEIFRAADSRRKLEQMYFDFTEAPARPKGRAKGSKNVPKTDAERADAFWKLNAATLSAPWALKSIPLVEWRVANFALTALQPLVTALKRRVSEGE